jgi:outer membrane protein assembly factor BamB
MTRRGPVPAAAALAALLALPFAVPSTPAAADDWPQFLGTRRDGTAAGLFGGPVTAPVKLRKVWQRPVEKAGAGLAVVGDRAYTLEAQEGADFAVALDAATGRELWRTRIDPTDPGALDETGPGSTPAVAGGRVFVLGTSCRLMGLDAASGQVVWQRRLREELGAGSHRVGCQTSPLLAGDGKGADRLIVQVNGEKENRLVAFEPATGQVVWGSKGVDRTSSSSPVLAELGGESQVVVHYLDRTNTTTGPISGLYGVRLTDGEVRWQVLLDQGLSSDTPLVLPGDRIVLLTWGDARLFQVTKAGDGFKAAQVWVNDALRANVGPPVHHDGHLYGFGQDSLACLDAATGKTVWKEKLYAGSVALADGRLVALSHASGLLHVAEATPAGYREQARLEALIPGPSGDTPPGLAGRRIFVRNADEIVAVEVGG